MRFDTLVLLCGIVTAACGTPSLGDGSAVRAEPANWPGTYANEYTVERREVSYAELDARTFDRSWFLPDERSDGGEDLVADMRALLALVIERQVGDERRTVRFGDLVAEVWALEPEARAVWFVELETRAPAFMSTWGARVRELLFDDFLRSEDWKPDKDSPQDGMLFGASWPVHLDERFAWPNRSEKPRIEQAATLFAADFTAIKAVEADCRLYPTNIAADYEFIRPVANSYVHGREPADRAFAAHQLTFRCDLPFPFSSYDCNLHVYSRVNARGEYETHIYSPSPDFNYMGGRDVFLEVRRSDGTWVGQLAVRSFGFDLDGIPDDADDRREALRGALGNLRRNAERLFQVAGGARRDVSGELPSYTLRGVRSE